MLHIDLPNRAEIEALAAERADSCVTIYVATTPVTQEAQKGRIELKNLLREAGAQLAAVDADKRAAAAIEEDISGLIEDDDFWAHQANSLAIFSTSARTRTFRLPNRLESMVQVADRFHVKPLLRAVAFPQTAYVLVLAAGGVRLMEISADTAPQEMRVPDMPKDANQALGRRTIRDVNYAGGGGEGAGQVELLTRYARAVDRALRPVLSGRERPLIVAATEPLRSIWPRVNSYPHLADETIAGNAEQMSASELAEAARRVLDARHAAELSALAARFAERKGDGRATADISQAARAATYGAIDTLIVDMDAVVPGTVDADGSVHLADAQSGTTYGVVDEVTHRALSTGARVIAARRDDIPDGGDLAALLRYPL